MRFLLAALAVAFAGCDSVSDSDLLGPHVWVLVSGAEAVGAEVRFGSDGEFSARPVCNHVFGTYSTAGGRVDVDVVGTTRVHCGEGMDAEVAFNEALERVTRYEVEADRLALAGPDGELVFETGSR